MRICPLLCNYITLAEFESLEIFYNILRQWQGLWVYEKQTLMYDVSITLNFNLFSHAMLQLLVIFTAYAMTLLFMWLVPKVRGGDIIKMIMLNIFP